MIKKRPTSDVLNAITFILIALFTIVVIMMIIFGIYVLSRSNTPSEIEEVRRGLWRQHISHIEEGYTALKYPRSEDYPVEYRYSFGQSLLRLAQQGFGPMSQEVRVTLRMLAELEMKHDHYHRACSWYKQLWQIEGQAGPVDHPCNKPNQGVVE